MKVENVRLIGMEGLFDLCSYRHSNSDSYATYIEDADHLETANYEYFIGENDLQFLKENKTELLKMMNVCMKLEAPLYFWDVLRTGTISNTNRVGYYDENTRYLIISYEELVNAYVNVQNYFDKEVLAEMNEFLDWIPYKDFIKECASPQINPINYAPNGMNTVAR